MHVRRLHGDLGARHDEIIGIGRDIRDDAERVEKREQNHRGHRRCNERRDADPQKPDEAAVPRGAREARLQSRMIDERMS